MKIRYYFLLFFLLVASPNLLNAQSAKTEFGSNRIQYKKFNWRYYSSSNFDIYFYDDGEGLAKLSAAYMEEAYQEITELIGYSPYSKTKIFLYNSNADLLQSNVGVNQSPFAVGGQATFTNTQVEVAFPGTLYSFKQELKYQVTKSLVLDMMFGGSLRDVFQSAYLLTLPDWYIEGIARYIAYGWGVEMDDYIRQSDALRSNLKLYRLQGREAALMGQAIWNYIAEKHGRASVSNILNYTRIVRNGETAISNTLGLPFKNFQKAFNDFYLPAANKELSEYSASAKAVVINENKKATRDNAFNSVALSANGQYLAYSESNRGRYSIRLKNIGSGKSTTLIRTGYKALDQELDDSIPLLSWKDSVTLGVFSVYRGQYALYLVNTRNGKSERHLIKKVSQVNDFSFSPNGKVVVMSAEKGGRNDIYLYSLGRKSLTAVTNDLYDDITPVFIPGTNNIVFSSNRQTDSLNVKDNVGLDDISSIYNLYLFNVDTTDKVLAKLTNLVGKNYKPQAGNGRNLYFLSDQKGIVNMYRYGLDDNLVWQITTNSASYTDYTISPDASALAYIAWQNGDEKVFYESGLNLSNNSFTGPTRRQSIWQVRFVKQHVNQAKLDSAQAKLEAVPPKILVTDSIGTIGTALSADSASTTNVADSVEVDTVVTQADTLEATAEAGLIDPENYIFEEIKTPTASASNSDQRQAAPIRKRESFLTSYRRNRKKEAMKGPFKMEPRFIINSFTLNAAFDPLRASLNASRENDSPFLGGLGVKLETQVSDLLENQKFYAGAYIMTNLRSGTLFAEYEYLKYLVDFRVRYDRSVVLDRMESIINEFRSNKFVLDKAEFSIMYPFSNNLRLEVGPQVANTQYLPLYAYFSGNQAENLMARSTFMAGGQAKLIYDDTRVLDFNILNGTRAFLHYSILEGINNKEQGHGRLLLDFRHYQRISRTITLATRAYYGRFIGNSQPYFILGGVDNQIASSTNISNKVNNPYYQLPETEVASSSNFHQDDRNILFYQFATPLRGYKYNAMYGTNSMLFNLELRVPVVQYLYRGPITSNFFRNLQFTGFLDVGTAWSGSSLYPIDGANTGPLDAPITSGNQSGGPFVITVTDYSNPWLSGYGGGIRTVVLGYYAKLDLAWPMQDYEVGKPRLHLSLGFDF